MVVPSYGPDVQRVVSLAASRLPSYIPSSFQCSASHEPCLEHAQNTTLTFSFQIDAIALLSHHRFASLVLVAVSKVSTSHKSKLARNSGVLIQEGKMDTVLRSPKITYYGEKSDPDHEAWLLKLPSLLV